MKKYIFYLTLFILALVSIIATALFYQLYTIKEIRRIGMDLKVGEKIGVNADTDAIHFGMIPRGNSGTRNILLSHKYNKPLKVEIRLSGELSEWVDVSDNNFYLGPDETKVVSFTVSVPKNAAYGNYTGEVLVFFRRF